MPLGLPERITENRVYTKLLTLPGVTPSNPAPLTRLRKFIAKGSEQNAALVVQRILNAIDLLQTQPEMGRPGRIVASCSDAVIGTGRSPRWPSTPIFRRQFSAQKQGDRRLMQAETYIEQPDSGYSLTGTRVSLDSLVQCFTDGLSPEAILEKFNSLTLAQVYGAITFYRENHSFRNSSPTIFLADSWTEAVSAFQTS